MNNKKIVLITLSLFFIASCNMSDTFEELPGDYTFVHEGVNYNFIGGKNEIYPDVIEYSFNKDFILACQKPNKFFYKILYASDLSNRYTLYYSYLNDSISGKYYKSRKEILADSTIAKIFKNKKVSFENNSKDIKKGEIIADSIIKNNPIHKKIFFLKKVYWIIQIKGDILFGPYSKKEYLFKRKNIGIDKDLQLKEN